MMRASAGAAATNGLSKLAEGEKFRDVFGIGNKRRHTLVVGRTQRGQPYAPCTTTEQLLAHELFELDDFLANASFVDAEGTSSGRNPLVVADGTGQRLAMSCALMLAIELTCPRVFGPSIS